MELNGEIVSALALINSNHLGEDDLQQILQQCTRILTNAAGDEHREAPDDKSMIGNILSFAINSLLLEAVKCNVNEASLVRLLAEHKLDCTTTNFKLFIDFIHSTLPKVEHNLNHLELNPLPAFRRLEWSQMLDIKSSSLDSIKEKSYLLDLLVDDHKSAATGSPSSSSNLSSFSMVLSQRELQDLHLTLRDCAKSLENFVSK